MPKHFFVLHELYIQDKFDRNVLPQQILKQKNTSAHKKASFLYAKIVSEKFAVTYSFNSSERLSTDTERQHGGKIQRHFARRVSAE